MADKFTPYGLTALPSAIEDRDPNGVYFIRTATGFKIVCIANDPNRTPVELDYPEVVLPDTSILVPYTGADKPIDFNTQDLTTGGYTNRLHSYFERINLASDSTASSIVNFKLLTNVAAAEIGNAFSQTSDIIITLPITTTTHWQAEIDILRSNYRTTLNIGAYGTSNTNRFVSGVYGNTDDILEVKFGRIGNSTVLIIKRSNSTIHRLNVNISKFYYHHTNSVNLYNDKSKYKVEYIDEGDLEGFTLNGTVLNKDFVRDSFYLDYMNNFLPLSGGHMSGRITMMSGSSSIPTIRYQIAPSGGWARRMIEVVSNDLSTRLGGFGAYGNGTNQTLTYLYFGDSYLDSWLRIYPNGDLRYLNSVGKIGGSANNILLEDGSVLDKNTLATTAQIPTVGNGEIKYTGTGAITGGGVSTANQEGNTSYTFDLTSTTKSDITKGVTAHGWGNHADEGYATEEFVGDAIDDIEIGGRNYAIGFNDEKVVAGGFAHNFGIIPVKPNDHITVSFYVKSDVPYSGNLFTHQFHSVESPSGIQDRVSYQWLTGTINSEYTYYKETIKIPNDSSIVSYTLGQRTPTGTVVYVKKVKLEKGNKATDWSPAPEDLITDWNETNPDSFAFLKNKPTTFPPSEHTHTFASLTSKPTTIGGYGITDFNSLGDARWALRTRTITGTGSLTGGGNLTENRTIDLSTTTKSDIEKGVTAHGWGNHADAGYVDLISPQHIDGSKTFNNIGLKLQGLYHVPSANGDALIYHLEDPNGRNGLQITANKDSNLKSMNLDISDLQSSGTDLRAQYLELSEKVTGEKNTSGEAVNYLGWKKVFDIVTSSIILTANTMTTIALEHGNLPVLAWDDGQAYMQGTHWDIVWELQPMGTLYYKKFSLKGTYGKHVLDTTEIVRTHTGVWQLRLAVDIDLTIPEGAKLVIW